jgi:inner membrane protein
MASAFGHATMALAGTSFLPESLRNRLIIGIGMISSALPDLDVITFRFGIPYEHMFGHRGFTHSIFFAIIWALCMSLLIKRSNSSHTFHFIPVLLFMFFCTVSHGILDGCTTGGRGVAFFAPFSDHRYFLPWRVIKVSPLSMERFFTHRGVAILKNEAIYIGIPSLVIYSLGKLINKKK